MLLDLEDHGVYESKKSQGSKFKSQDLEFDSKFECGNLNLAYKQNSDEYDLLLQNDVNTDGNTQ